MRVPFYTDISTWRYNSSPVHQILKRLALCELSWHTNSRFTAPDKLRLQTQLRSTLIKVEVADAPPPSLNRITMLSELATMYYDQMTLAWAHSAWAMIGVVCSSFITPRAGTIVKNHFCYVFFILERSGAHSQARGVLFGQFRLISHYMLVFLLLDVFI